MKGWVIHSYFNNTVCYLKGKSPVILHFDPQANILNSLITNIKLSFLNRNPTIPTIPMKTVNGNTKE